MPTDSSIALVAEAIIAAAPDFRATWERYRASADYAANEPYNHLGHLAHHLVAAARAGRQSDFAPVFAEIETQLASATPAARELIIVGFLEDLQNISLNRDVSLATWMPWLGKQTAEAWQVLMDMWSGKLAPGEFNRHVTGGALEQ